MWLPAGMRSQTGLAVRASWSSTGAPLDLANSRGEAVTNRQISS